MKKEYMQAEGHSFHKEELKQILDNVLNKTLGEADVNHVFDKTEKNPKITGIAGDVIEQSVLGFASDNLQRPDLKVDGIATELKTTGICLSKKGRKYEAKEPMTITAVSPDKIVLEQFEHSNLWHKLKHMLLVYYHYASAKTVKASEYADFYIRGYEFHEFDADDEARLKNDWEIVRNFILEIQNTYENPQSQYPRISSELRDRLVYLDTAPKWPHHPRFRLKRRVVTGIVQNHFGDRLEQLPEHYYGYADLDKKCHAVTQKDAGKTVLELAEQYHLFAPDRRNWYRICSKSVNEAVIVRMFGGASKKLNRIELFQKFGVIGKTVTVTRAGNRTEDTKLFAIDFDEWTDQHISFKESRIYDYFTNHQFLCMLFEEPSKEAPLHENRFLGFKRLSFPEDFIWREVKSVWEEVRSLVLENKLEETVCFGKNGQMGINQKTGTVRTSLNFPKSKDHRVFIRGGGIDARFKTESVNGIRMYRQYVWIKGSYITEALSRLPLL